MLNYLNDENKTLVFTEDEGRALVTLTLQMPEYQESIDISTTLQYFQGDRSLYSFRVFDPHTNQYTNLPESGQLPLHFFFSPIVMFKYRQPSETEFVEPVERRQRNQQRTIKEVISAVKRWRSYRCSQNGTEPKVSLEQAARLVGISKRSLDDYFGQLRLGELYGFNFSKHLEKKFGLLRAFVKKHKQKTRKPTNSNMKYPKRLRIMESLDQKVKVSQDRQPAIQTISILSTVVEQREHPDEPHINKSTPMEKLQEDEFEDQFYRCYELLLNEPKDPFVPFVARDYRQYRSYREQQDYSFEQMPW